MISYQLNLLIHPYKDLNNRNFSEVGIYDNVPEDLPTSHTFTWNEYHKTISAEVLDKIFGIEIERARETQRENSERGTLSNTFPVNSRYRVDWHYIIKSINGATYTIWSRSRYPSSNVSSIKYRHKYSFNEYYHMSRANNKNVGYSLNEFISDYGEL